MNKARSVLAIAMVVAVFALAPQFAMAQNKGTHESEAVQIAKLISTAKTSADHRKIAEYYQKQAKEAEQKAKDVNAFGDCYQKMARKGEFARSRRDCALMVVQYRKIAKEDEQMARTHFEIAKKLAKEGK